MFRVNIQTNPTKEKYIEKIEGKPNISRVVSAGRREIHLRIIHMQDPSVVFKLILPKNEVDGVGSKNPQNHNPKNERK